MTDSNGEVTAKEVAEAWGVPSDRGARVMCPPEYDRVIAKALRVLVACEEYEGFIERTVASAVDRVGDHHPVLVPASFLRTLATLMQEGREK